ncbi:hypothetical protein Tel_10780 [Candidatus Tenderia electrophaga]|uniref:Uncharacterized protein n=1 Tax=Candidatus Tenderia electrophaga TaxID=1748243 RepID=A0A0S2TEJ6_9GAMM|nr:hypothetical protein Tel_10780 [Candidatus Tenderia electrophaga]
MIFAQAYIALKRDCPRLTGHLALQERMSALVNDSGGFAPMFVVAQTGGCICERLLGTESVDAEQLPPMSHHSNGEQIP